MKTYWPTSQNISGNDRQAPYAEARAGDYPELSPEDNAARRKEWDRIRKSYRDDWSKRFGEWPDAGGKSWPVPYTDN